MNNLEHTQAVHTHANCYYNPQSTCLYTGFANAGSDTVCIIHLQISTETRLVAMGYVRLRPAGVLHLQIWYQSDRHEEAASVLAASSPSHCQHHLLRGHIRQTHAGRESGRECCSGAREPRTTYL